MRNRRSAFLSWLPIPRKYPYRQRFSPKHQSEQGLSLIELLVAVTITSVVILIAGYGLIVAMNGEKIAQATSARRSELNRAFDFMTNEIRMAQAINRTASFPANGASASVEDVVTNAGILTALGSYGDLVLYLEVPTTNPTATCPTGAPPSSTPRDYDRIVYDIRPSPDGWLGPRTIHRYGRTPKADGTINPCSTPVSSDVLVDAISEQLDTVPTCDAPGNLTGNDGFMACVNGAQVDLYLQSSITGKKVRKLNSAASSRLVSIQQALNSPIQLAGNRPITSDEVSLSWTYTGSTTPTAYELYHTWGNSTSTSYSGSNTSSTFTLPAAQPGEHVFLVEAKSGTQILGKSNEVRFTK